MQVIDGEVYFAIQHPVRQEEMHVWFDEASGQFLRGHSHFKDGTVRHFPTYDDVEAALMGVAL